ncbi:MAG: COX15/CtaA family protein [Propionicimonas sp.]
MDLLSSPTALKRWTLASLVSNMLLIVTGGLVRVTQSGLGCSTWPECEPGAYLPHPEAGAHAFIEFGNRLLTFVLVAVAIGTLVAAWQARDSGGRPRTRLRVLALCAAAGIPAQAIIGGFSVLTNLNPWVVGAHLLPSIALIVVSVAMLHEAHGVRPDAKASVPARRVALGVFVLGMVVMVLGAVVTGAGPNSGDGGAARNGLNLEAVARVHALSVWATVAGTVLLLVLTRGTIKAWRSTVILLVVEILQGMIGYAQYVLSLPPALVVAHMAGTALFTAMISHVLLVTRAAHPSSSPRP